MRLGLISLGISLVIGVCFGVLQARYKDGIFDHIGTAYTVFVNAVPSLVTYSLVLAFGAVSLDYHPCTVCENPSYPLFYR